MAKVNYIKNEELKTILPDWPGNLFIKERFVDPNKRFSTSFKNFLKWQFSKNEKKATKKNDTWRLKVIKGNEFLQRDDNCLVWLGHASFFIQLNGVRMMTDPVFGRISGVVPRYSELPCLAADIRNIDYVLLSHAHRDHCDKSSLQQLSAHNNFELLTGLKTPHVFRSWIKGIHWQEAGWYQQYNLPQANLKITFLPTQHWSNRYGWDTNKTLWGSFMIEADGLTIFFGGDSGYSNYTKQIGELFPNIDIAMIGAGAYTPNYMMEYAHTSPQEAVQAFHDLGAKTLVPMHYGTFDLADEPLSEPYHLLKEMEQNKTINGAIHLLHVGEVMSI